MRLPSVVFGLVLLAIGGCGQPPAPDSPAPAGLQQQLDAAKAENDSLRTRLEEAIPELTGERASQNQCPGGVTVLVRSSAGKTCDDYAAVIAGWSEQCVADGACDPAKRLAELNAAGNATCQSFCAKQGCDQWQFAPPQQCAKQNCVKSGACPSECPVIDECFLKQHDDSPNCWCTQPSG
ncbi:MAG: hypothetical protein AB7O49_20685 [Sphingomonadales bacterium]